MLGDYTVIFFQRFSSEITWQ
uniref:Uncharacterized protein n=1 Tax=Anopheles albimanus TaxID=7167 RepID=A0A182FYJ7_ANOAL